MPGTGHSSRHKGSITGRSSKSAFQVLAPWNARKNGEVNQVPVSSGAGPINFKLLDAKMMSNYDKNKDEFILDCSLNVKGNKTVNGTTKMIGDVDCCGNVTIQGTLHVANASITDASINRLTDVCDNVLTLGNHEALKTNHMRGIFMKTYNFTNGINDHAFMGYDPSGTFCPYGPVPKDTHGQFLFLTGQQSGSGTDLSFNKFAPDISCNIFGGDLGRVAMGTLDISGSSRYGDAGPGVGAPTNGVTGQNDCSMHLVGKTIIAQQGGAFKPLDISGGINVKATGPTKLGGTLEVTGDTTLGTLTAGASTLASAIVNGVTTLTGNATFGGDLLSATTTAAQNVFATTTGLVTIGDGDVNISATGSTTTVKGDLTVDQANATFGGNLLSLTTGNPQNVFNTTTAAVTIGGGDVNISALNSTTTVKGDLTVDGDTNVSTFESTGKTDLATSGGPVSIASTGLMTTVKGGLTVDQDSTLTGTLGVGGATILSNGLTVNGGDAQINNALNVGGTAEFGNTVTATDGLNVTLGFSAASNKFSVLPSTGNTDIDGTLDVTGDTSVSTFDSTGATSLATAGGVVNIASSGVMTTVKGTLNVDEAVTFDTTLDVTGNISCNGITIDASGITLDGDSSISGYSGDISGATIVNNNMCGRIDISGTLDPSPGGTNGDGISYFTMKNNKLSANSIVLVTLDSGPTLSTLALCRLAPIELDATASPAQCNIGIFNPGPSQIIIQQSDKVRVHFMIINPTS